MRKNLIYLIIILVVSYSCEKNNEITEIDETQIILDSLSNYRSFIYYETNEDTIYGINFQYSGCGSIQVEPDSLTIYVEVGYEIGLEDTISLIWTFITQETPEKVVQFGIYENFEDYCKLFDTGNLYFANSTNKYDLHRGILLRYFNSDTNSDIDNYSYYTTLTDEDVLSHSDFIFHIDKTKIFFEAQLVEFYYTFNCEVALCVNGEFLGKKLAITNGHGKMTIAFYRTYP